MAKNKDNRMKNSSKNSSSNQSKNNNSGNSMKDSVAQFPDNRPSRSGPGGE